MELGMEGRILQLNVGISIFNFCEDLARDHSEAIILTDWDRRGGHLCRSLLEGLAANGVRPNGDVRARLAALCRKEIKDVQSLVGYLRRLQALAESPSDPAKAEKMQIRRARRMSREMSADRLKE